MDNELLNGGWSDVILLNEETLCTASVEFSSCGRLLGGCRKLSLFYRNPSQEVVERFDIYDSEQFVS